MQTNLIGRSAFAEVDKLNPKAKGDKRWSPGPGDSYWVRAEVTVEIVAACTTGQHAIPCLIVLDGDGELHEVRLSEIRIAPPAHPLR